MQDDAVRSVSATDSAAKDAASEPEQQSAQDYLETTVMGVLAQGLEDVCRVRPANPVDYLALYLLRRSQSGKPVEVPYAEAIPVVSERRNNTDSM